MYCIICRQWFSYQILKKQDDDIGFRSSGKKLFTLSMLSMASGLGQASRFLNPGSLAKLDMLMSVSKHVLFHQNPLALHTLVFKEAGLYQKKKKDI